MFLQYNLSLSLFLIAYIDENSFRSVDFTKFLRRFYAFWFRILSLRQTVWGGYVGLALDHFLEKGLLLAILEASL